MATSKPSSKADTDKTSTDKTTAPDEAVAAAMPEPGDGSYAGKAAELAARVRDTSDQIREQIEDLNDQVNDLQQNNTPTAAEGPAADGVRRIPMAAGEVLRALDGLNAAAADLTRRATS